MRESTPPVRALCVFVGLNLADLLLTWRLLGDGHSPFYESNPIARWWLTQGGWPGLVAFKGLIVTLVISIFLILSQHRPEAGKRLLCFASSVLIVVVLYSTSLASCRHAAVGAAEEPAVQALNEQKQLLEEEVRTSQEYTLELWHLSQELAACHCSLEEAVGRLSMCRKAQSPAWLDYLQQHFGVASARAGVAANLIHYTVASLSGEPEVAARIAHHLEAEFRALYGGRLFVTRN